MVFHCLIYVIFITLDHPGSTTVKTFYSAWKSVTDYGPCCLITPYLNFVNPETKNITPGDYKSEHLHSLPRGSQNGQIGGLKFLLDVESFDFSFSGKESLGFIAEYSDHRDKSMINKDGYFISPGIKIS